LYNLRSSIAIRSSLMSSNRICSGIPSSELRRLSQYRATISSGLAPPPLKINFSVPCGLRRIDPEQCFEESLCFLFLIVHICVSVHAKHLRVISFVELVHVCSVELQGLHLGYVVLLMFTETTVTMILLVARLEHLRNEELLHDRHDKSLVHFVCDSASVVDGASQESERVPEVSLILPRYLAFI
jgi:hypothetical protein